MSIKYYDKSGATPEEKLLAGISPVDAILSPTSKNAIQNKAVYNALRDKLEAATTDLINYYLKTDVYNKSEVRALIGAVETLTMEVVSSLPVSDISTTTIYLLKPTGSNVYDEYVYINDAWVKIGTTDLDLSGYMLTADFNVAIADYFTKTEINNLLNSYYTKAEIDADFYNKDSVDDLLDAKQDTLTFDSVPTASSSNPVTSDGIKNAIDAKKFSNPNLLDNPWFTVNQRGFNNASGGGTDSYRFDRWRGTYGYDTTNNIPAFTGVQYAIQRLESSVKNFLNGKLLTASVMYSDGEIESGTFTYYKQPSDWITVSNITKVYVQIGYNATASDILNGSFCITNKNTNLSIKAVKLELGTIPTLINDVPPNYPQELAKCQRYFTRLRTSSTHAYAHLGPAMIRTTTQARIFVPLPVTMRESLSVTANIAVAGGLKLIKQDGTVSVPITAVALDSWSVNGVGLTASTDSQSTIAVGTACEGWIHGSSDSYIDVSADL